MPGTWSACSGGWSAGSGSGGFCGVGGIAPWHGGACRGHRDRGSDALPAQLCLEVGGAPSREPASRG
jgi:hypothetical protein